MFLLNSSCYPQKGGLSHYIINATVPFLSMFFLIGRKFWHLWPQNLDFTDFICSNSSSSETDILSTWKSFTYCIISSRKLLTVYSLSPLSSHRYILYLLIIMIPHFVFVDVFRTYFLNICFNNNYHLSKIDFLNLISKNSHAASKSITKLRDATFALSFGGNSSHMRQYFLA